MLKRALLATVCVALGTTAFANTAVKLGPNAAMTGGDYSTGGGLTVAMETREIGGKLGLCGVWAQSESMSIYTRHEAPRILARGVASLNGQVITKDFGFLNRVRPSESYTGAPANCVVLNRAWSPSDGSASLTLRIPRQKVFNTSNSRRENGPRVFFTKSDSRNPAFAKGSILPSSVTSYSSNSSQW